MNENYIEDLTEVLTGIEPTAEEEAQFQAAQQIKQDQSVSRQGGNGGLVDLYKEPTNYFERQRYGKIEFNKTSPFSEMKIYENTLIGFKGVPGSCKTSICLKMIQDIIDTNDNYKAVLFSLELNRDITVSKLAKVPVHMDYNINREEAEAYARKDQEYINKYIKEGKIGIIDRTADIPDDIMIIGNILRDFQHEHYERESTAEFTTYEQLKEFRASTKTDKKLIIFLDYFDILRVDENHNKDEYSKQDYIINSLKEFRDNYKFVTFFVINSTNKAGLSGELSQASTKGNTAILFGYDQDYSIQNLPPKTLARLEAEEPKPNQSGNLTAKQIKEKHRYSAELKRFNACLTPRPLDDNEAETDSNIYQGEGLIIIEDTKSRYGSPGTHAIKAIKGYSEFIGIKDFINTETAPTAEKAKEKKETKNKVEKGTFCSC